MLPSNHIVQGAFFYSHNSRVSQCYDLTSHCLISVVIYVSMSYFWLSSNSNKQYFRVIFLTQSTNAFGISNTLHFIILVPPRSSLLINKTTSLITIKNISSHQPDYSFIPHQGKRLWSNLIVPKVILYPITHQRYTKGRHNSARIHFNVFVLLCPRWPSSLQPASLLGAVCVSREMICTGGRRLTHATSLLFMGLHCSLLQIRD